MKAEVKTTDFGKEVVEIANRMLADAMKIQRRALLHQDPEEKPLKIGLTPTLAPYLTKYFVDMLWQLCPNVQVTLHEDAPNRLVDMVETCKLDVACLAAQMKRAG